MAGCAVLHYFALKHITVSGINLTSVVSPRMFKRDSMLQYKTLRVAQRALSRVAKEVIAELRPATYEHHLLFGLKDKETPKKAPEKQSKKKKKVVDEVPINLSLEFNDIFMLITPPHQKGYIRRPRERPISILWV